MTEIRRSDLPADFFDLVPGGALRSAFFPEGCPQNSIWDFYRTRAGRYYVSLCAEGHVSASARLFEFRPEALTFNPVFDLDRICRLGPRAIPPSKIHTSIDELPDGRLIMVTHTTAPAPGHPFWMLDAYYSHPWEGFAGSHLLIFDPTTGSVENRGIPVPRETLYGGIYDPRHGAYYLIGFIRGHLYRYDVASDRVRDLGQVSEWGSFRLSRGPDGHVYGSTRTGWLFRVDVDRVRVEDLNYRLPGTPGLLSRRQFAFAATGPDGRFYIAHHCSDRLVALDPATGRIEDVGSIDPGPPMPPNGPRCVAGMGFDEVGRLWYGLASHVGGGPGFWTHLACWDVTRGGRPENRGLLGTPDRAAYYVSELIAEPGRLLIADTNHGMDSPGIRIVDLARLDALRDQPRAVCRDPFAYAYLVDGEAVAPLDRPAERMAPYRRLLEHDAACGRFMAQNPFTIQAESVSLYPLWRQVPPEQSAVRRLEWIDETELRGVCGEAPALRAFRIRGGEWSWDSTPVKADPAPVCPGVIAQAGALPARPGRHYLAQPSAWTPWNGGRWLVGTRDGLLAVVDPQRGTVFNLGPVCPQGPVRALATDAARTRAYGIAGDEDDLGSCFYVDDRSGVRELGRAFTRDDAPWGSANSCLLSALAVSPSGDRVAIGSADRLGTIYLYHRIQGVP